MARAKADREAIQQRGDEQRRRREVLGPLEELLAPEWLDPDFMSRMVDFGTSLFRCVVIHGLITLALKHPELSDSLREIGAEVKENLEGAMEAEGLRAPRGGWDATGIERAG